MADIIHHEYGQLNHDVKVRLVNEYLMILKTNRSITIVLFFWTPLFHVSRFQLLDKLP